MEFVIAAYCWRNLTAERLRTVRAMYRNGDR